MNSKYQITSVWAALLTSALVAISCKSGMKSTSETQNKEVDSEWIILFDGTSTKGWRGYNMDVLPPGWIISQGALTFVHSLDWNKTIKEEKILCMVQKSLKILNYT